MRYPSLQSILAGDIADDIIHDTQVQGGKTYAGTVKSAPYRHFTGGLASSETCPSGFHPRSTRCHGRVRR